ncbi:MULTISPECIES: endonuclease domain-containing protein [unclassified Sphingobium]|uniref:endonuclease domain-containing protein n=1 Tax=unclassified Sphingobium TaxID=2611147 RepID=UPI00119A3C10|nr:MULTISPECIES: endonuclease domain-containing protein [unclassified Sphingobium]MBG6118721.1 very-short-patch-repair endonuclease [Sphingobium sp. JAI105]TWD10594.1 very-short-patch-repair endonuclease [Sphingobium sp. AEW010]TWD28001.1 very-short-patch-repair endonuclease [Sphingobium sp. AEW013]TWD28928.1 very-short-patch-repair endonuclease [Sphingobium sp. AEW001]
MRRPDPATPDSLNRVRAMRRDPTEPERRLWASLRGRQLAGLKFRRQVWLIDYIADFYCVDRRLVIEVDGDDHAVREAADRHRSERLAREGIRIVRFANADVMSNIDGVLETILMTAHQNPSPSHPAAPGGPLPLPQGERGI